MTPAPRFGFRYLGFGMHISRILCKNSQLTKTKTFKNVSIFLNLGASYTIRYVFQFSALSESKYEWFDDKLTLLF